MKLSKLFLDCAVNFVEQQQQQLINIDCYYLLKGKLASPAFYIIKEFYMSFNTNRKENVTKFFSFTAILFLFFFFASL